MTKVRVKSAPRESHANGVQLRTLKTKWPFVFFLFARSPQGPRACFLNTGFLRGHLFFLFFCQPFYVLVFSWGGRVAAAGFFCCGLLCLCCSGGLLFCLLGVLFRLLCALWSRAHFEATAQGETAEAEHKEDDEATKRGQKKKKKKKKKKEKKNERK